MYTALLVLMSAALYMIFIFAPAERVQGDAQRLLYGHVAVAWLAFLAFGFVVVASVMYLWRRDPRWDSLAVSAAEVGVLFTTLTLVTGAIWGRVIWNVWWTWDPRLTTTLVLWFIYTAYLALRMYIDNVDVRRRVAAIFGILGFRRRADRMVLRAMVAQSASGAINHARRRAAARNARHAAGYASGVHDVLLGPYPTALSPGARRR